MTDDSKGDKIERMYNKLICSVIEMKSELIVSKRISDIETHTGQKMIRDDVLHDAEKYFVHYQAGRKVLVLKKCPLGRVLIAKADAAEDEMNMALMRKNYHRGERGP